MKQYLKKFSLVISIVVVVIIVVLTKTFDRDHFRNNAEQWANPSISQTNLITPERLYTLEEKALIVDVSDNGNLSGNFVKAVNIPSGSLMDKENLKKLRDHKGSIILVSEDKAMAARVWMLLSQMGFKELYILSDSSENEVFKYKFRTDRLISPES